MQEIWRCAKSWQTPCRSTSTRVTGVAIVVDDGSNVNSVKIRCISATAAATSGRPGGKASRAKAASSGAIVVYGDAYAILSRLAGFHPLAIDQRLAHRFPWHALLGIDIGRTPIDLDHATARHAHLGMGRQHREVLRPVAEVIDPLADLRGAGRVRHFERTHLLPGKHAGPQVRDVL